MKVLHVLLLTTLLYLVQATATQLKEISYAFIYSGGGGGGFNSSNAMPAIYLAEEMIRNNSTILAGYNLRHTAPRDSQCDRTTSLNQFFQSVPSSDPPVLALLGSGCSVATEPVAEIVHYWNISQIAFATSSSTLDDRKRFPNFFRTYPSGANFASAIRSVVEFYGWTRVMFLTQDENLFTTTYALARDLLPQTITVENIVLQIEDPIQLPPASELFNTEENFRVFFINSYSGVAKEIICEALKSGLTYPDYAWITFGWYQSMWWTDNRTQVDCTDQELEAFLERVLALHIFPFPDDPTAPTYSGLSAKQFYDQYEQKTNQTLPRTLPDVSTIAYDAVWALAIALDRTAIMVNTSETNMELVRNCSVPANSPELVALENFTYSNSFMGCVIRWNLAQTNFVGVSGPVKFNDLGSRLLSNITVRQYRVSAGGTVERVKIGLINVNSNFLSYVVGENETTVYPKGVPPDGAVIVRAHLLILGIALLVIFGLINV